jgi:hypothetical protein
MTFDLLKYAAAHRYRVRNLHDGRPVPPFRVRVTKRGKAKGYVAAEDRQDAVIGLYGYVSRGCDGRLEWLLRRTKGKAAALRRLEAAGVVVVQDAHGEAAGHAPVTAIQVIVEAIQPYTRKEVPVGRAPATRLNASTPA